MQKQSQTPIEGKSSQILEFSDEEESDEDDFYLASPHSQNDSVKEVLSKIHMSQHKGIRKYRINKSKDISDFYDFQDKIGEGSFGKVYKAVHKDTGKLRAIKMLYKKQMANKADIMTEIENLKKLDHPNVIRLYEYYETKSKLFLVQELLQGEELY
jgi:calcium-dependent protein kinase